MVKTLHSIHNLLKDLKSTPWTTESLGSLRFPLSSLFPEGFSSPFRCACLPCDIFRIAPTHTFLLLYLDTVATSTANPEVYPRSYTKFRSLTHSCTKGVDIAQFLMKWHLWQIYCHVWFWNPQTNWPSSLHSLTLAQEQPIQPRAHDLCYGLTCKSWPEKVESNCPQYLYWIEFLK